MIEIGSFKPRSQWTHIVAASKRDGSCISQTHAQEQKRERGLVVAPFDCKFLFPRTQGAGAFSTIPHVRRDRHSSKYIRGPNPNALYALLINCSLSFRSLLRIYNTFFPRKFGSHSTQMQQYPKSIKIHYVLIACILLISENIIQIKIKIFFLSILNLSLFLSYAFMH